MTGLSYATKWFITLVISWLVSARCMNILAKDRKDKNKDSSPNGLELIFALTGVLSFVGIFAALIAIVWGH